MICLSRLHLWHKKNKEREGNGDASTGMLSSIHLLLKKASSRKIFQGIRSRKRDFELHCNRFLNFFTKAALMISNQILLWYAFRITPQSLGMFWPWTDNTTGYINQIAKFSNLTTVNPHSANTIQILNIFQICVEETRHEFNVNRHEPVQSTL